MTMTLKSAKESAGKLSLGNGKMPGSTFATDAFACKVGDKLAQVKGSVCDSCYARKLQKLRPSVNQGWSNNQRLAVNLIANAPEKWVAAMVFQIEKAAIKSGQPFHRWFDSGDLDSIDMLAAIVKVTKKTPHIKHWLPTRESGIVKAYRKQGGSIPRNLRIRLSATMVGDKPLTSAKRLGVSTSTVHTDSTTIHGKECLAYRTDLSLGVVSLSEYKQARKARDKSYDFGHCGACRHCWTSATNVSYGKH
jgi:hypothetical protein